MSAPFNTGLRIAFIFTVLFSSIVARGQATQTASNSNALAVSLKMQSEQVQVGQTPWAILTVYNITDQPVIIDNTMRVYVYGKDGEAPTTLPQRQLTFRLRPGEAPLSRTLNVDPVSIRLWPAGGAGDWCDRKFQLAYLYDLSAPGKYTAYAEAMDPSSHRWLRTKSVTFEMTAPAQ
ncbi:MAG TPA: hypothetical protein VGG59_02595 [Acidobacteriaceae bacterium]|jgi:hypothetical protein